MMTTPCTTQRRAPRLVTLPAATYDLVSWLCFPLNYAIAGLCHLQPQTSIWNDTRKTTPAGSGKSLATLQQEILSQADHAQLEADLVRLYDTLPALTASDDLVGRVWRGRILRTRGSVLDLAEWAIVRPLGKLGFGWGKRYRSAEQGDPLLCHWREKVFFPLPLWGNVGVTDIRWRGQVTATMNYDHQPWKDYFKRLSADGEPTVLLGVWTHKHIAGGWFTLTLDDELSQSLR